jgi:hypothetical protein
MIDDFRLGEQDDSSGYIRDAFQYTKVVIGGSFVDILGRVLITVVT